MKCEYEALVELQYIDTGKPKYAETNLSQCQFFPIQIPRGVV